MIVNQVAVIIPVYKKDPNADELISLKQCIRILKNHPIIFIGPKKLNTAIYEETCNAETPFVIMQFDDHFFEDIEGYNKLMLSCFFYKTFIKYKYILIYQLDAFVFRDELAYWCDQAYDFIGAPQIPHTNNKGEMQFLKGYGKFLNIVNTIFGTGHKISNVGNGGFSLRNTKKCYWLLKILRSSRDRWGTNNEDGFFKYWGNIFYPLFKLPKDETALHFSVEEAPAASLKQLDNVLPFGCHAFNKYEPEVWHSIIYDEE